MKENHLTTNQKHHLAGEYQLSHEKVLTMELHEPIGSLQVPVMVSFESGSAGVLGAIQRESFEGWLASTWLAPGRRAP